MTDTRTMTDEEDKIRVILDSLQLEDAVELLELLLDNYQAMFDDQSAEEE